MQDIRGVMELVLYYGTPISSNFAIRLLGAISTAANGSLYDTPRLINDRWSNPILYNLLKENEDNTITDKGRQYFKELIRKHANWGNIKTFLETSPVSVGYIKLSSEICCYLRIITSEIDAEALLDEDEPLTEIGPLKELKNNSNWNKDLKEFCDFMSLNEEYHDIGWYVYGNLW